MATPKRQNVDLSCLHSLQSKKKSTILAYAIMITKGVETLGGVPIANLITDLFTQLRELEAQEAAAFIKSKLGRL